MKQTEHRRPQSVPVTPPSKPLNPLSRAAYERAMGGIMSSIMGKVSRNPRYGKLYIGAEPKLDGHDHDRIDAAKAKRARRNARRLNEFHR